MACFPSFLPSLSSSLPPSHSSKFFHRLHTDSTQENEAGGSTKNPRPAWETLGVPASLTYKLRLWFPRKKKVSTGWQQRVEGAGRVRWGGIIIIKVKGRRTHHLPATVTMQRALLRSPAPKQNQKFMFLQVHSHTHPCMWCYMCIYVCEGRRSTWTVFGSGSIFWNKVSHCTGVHPFIE